MNNSLTFVALFLISATVVIGQTCPANTVWNSCGSACREYCNKEPGPCTKECVADCFCDEASGYTKRAIDADNDDCILRSACVNCTDPNEIYKVCGPAPGCEDYCGRPDDTFCIQVCTEGCFCKTGYIRASETDRTCIPLPCPGQ